MNHVARFLAAYLRNDPTAAREEEVAIAVDGEKIPATLLHPPGRVQAPGWVVLHGITVPGRHHPSLVRFARSLCASGGTVLIPEIRAWKELRIDPDAAAATLTTASKYLAERPEVAPGGVKVIGFSFGATQALVTATDPHLRDAIRAVVGFGGYCDLNRTLRFMMTGEHEWEGVHRRLDPDPYGRWIIASNYLTRVPEYQEMEAVSRGAHELAAAAGRRGVHAAEPDYDPDKETIRRTLTPREREVWDLIAPPAGTPVPDAPARALADRLIGAALAVHPQLDPMPVLSRLDRRVVLVHGFGDRLVPFTETLRLRRALPDTADASATITRLFAHSKGAEGLRFWEYPWEVARYLWLLRRALAPD